MKRALLKNIPYPKANNIKSKYKYIGVAERKIIDHKVTLVIHAYKKEKNEYKSCFQIFCTKEEFITRWVDGAFSVQTLENLISIKNFKIVEGEDTIKEYFLSYFKRKNINTSSWNTFNFIISYQDNLKEKESSEKRRQKYLAEQEKVLPDMQLFKRINIKNYNKKIKKIAFKDVAFLFYEKDKNAGYCSVCQKEVNLNNMKGTHNVETVCPSCGKPVTFKNMKMGHKNLNFLRWSVKVETAGEKMLLRYFVHYWDLSKDYKNSEIETRELIRMIYYEDMTDNWFSYEYEPYKNEYIWTYYKKKYGAMGQEPSEFIRPKNVYLYNSISQFKKIVEKSAYRYSGVADFISDYMDNQYMPTPYMIDNYICEWIKKPYLEKFSKVGFSWLVIDMINSFYSSFSIKKEGSLPEMLGVTREHFKWLLEKKNPIYTDVKILREYPKISKKDYFLLVSLADYTRNYDAYMECIKYTTLYKLNKYLKAQNNVKDIRYYMDYLRMSEELGYDMKNTFNLFPKSLVQRHDERVAEHKLKKEEIEKEKIDAYNKELEKFMEQNKKALESEAFFDVQTSKFFKLGNLFIRLPFNTNEIKEEGEKLKHCVGSYVDRVVNGQTEIFLIRKVSEPDIPFYTLEWKNNEIKQCYGMRNCEATPEVQAFTDTFSQLMNSATIKAA